MPSVDARRMDALEAELLEAGEGARGGAFGRRREYLRLARAQRVRRPEAVATIGAELLSRADDRAALGDELYVVYEQVCKAPAPPPARKHAPGDAGAGALCRSATLTMRRRAWCRPASGAARTGVPRGVRL